MIRTVQAYDVLTDLVNGALQEVEFWLSKFDKGE